METGLPLFEESLKIIPQIFFRGIFLGGNWVFRGIFEYILEDMFDHLVISFKLLVFLSDKFNYLKNKSMSISCFFQNNTF